MYLLEIVASYLKLSFISSLFGWFMHHGKLVRHNSQVLRDNLCISTYQGLHHCLMQENILFLYRGKVNTNTVRLNEQFLEQENALVLCRDRVVMRQTAFDIYLYIYIYIYQSIYLFDIYIYISIRIKSYQERLDFLNLKMVVSRRWTLKSFRRFIEIITGLRRSSR